MARPLFGGIRRNKQQKSRSKKRKPKGHEGRYKGVLLYPKNEIDKAWKKISAMTIKGQLGAIAIATTRKCNPSNRGMYSISIYGVIDGRQPLVFNKLLSSGYSAKGSSDYMYARGMVV
jgi:hypothetical protein